MIEAFMHGFLLAFGLILPLGVQNVFVFNQGAVQPAFWRAVPVILTASLCDTLLILLAVLGVSLLVLSLAWVKTLLFVIGFFFLVYMGWATWRSNPSLQKEEHRTSFPAKKQILFAASVSLLNPHAILDTIGVIGTSSARYAGAEKGVFALACILVSWIWFFSLAAAGRTLGKLDHTGRWIKRLNRLSALIIWGAAAYIALQIL